MNVTKLLLRELQREGEATALTLGRVPTDLLGWRPQARSMTLGELASHIAEIPSKARRMLDAGEFDLSDARPSCEVSSDLADHYRANLASLVDYVTALDDDALERPFRFTRRGELMTSVPLLEFIRNVVMNHSYHHRGQLCVYLSLLEVPVPAIYGSSRDERPFD